MKQKFKNLIVKVWVAAKMALKENLEIKHWQSLDKLTRAEMGFSTIEDEPKKVKTRWGQIQTRKYIRFWGVESRFPFKHSQVVFLDLIHSPISHRSRSSSLIGCADQTSFGDQSASIGKVIFLIAMTK